MAEKKEYDFGKDCILIARVSTPAQVLKEGSSPQMAALRKYAEDLKYNKNTFKEINSVESGFLESDSKIGWNLVTDWIDKHPSYRTIIIVEMSRLSRRKTVLFHIQEYLIKNKIQLIIKDIDFTLLNKYGEVDLGKDFVFSLYASLAESEMRQKNERKKNALLEYKKSGHSIGGKKLFGYIRVKDPDYKDKKKYEIDPIQADQVEQVFKMYAYGIDYDLTRTSSATIVLECRKRGYDKYLHSKRNVQNLLKNEAYTGYKITRNKIKNKDYFNYMNYDAPKYINGTSFECVYPRIIDDGLFQLVQDRLKKESTHNEIGADGQTKDKSSKHLNTVLSKILRCRFCGSYFVADYRVDKYGFPKFSYRDGGARAHKNLRKCEHGQTVSMKMLDAAIWAFVKEMVSDITLKQREAKSESNLLKVEQEIENLKKGYAEIDRRLKTANKIFEMSAGLRTDYDDALREYSSKLKDIENDRKQIDREIASRDRQLQILKNSKNDNIEEAITSNIDLIESCKAEVSKYVHLLVKEAVILENNMPYTVLQITSVNNIDEVFNYAEDDSVGLPKIVKKKNDGRYYMLIEKDYHGNYNARVITNQVCQWNDEEKLFMVGEDRYDIPFIFNVDVNEEDVLKMNVLTGGLKILDVKPLDLYDEDLTEGMKKKMMERMAGEALE